jgi:predicted nuclease with TOPRIM domain
MAQDSEVLARLTGRVHEAVEEIERLRIENVQLSESLKVLWAKTKDTTSGTSVVFDGDREELKVKLRSYIAVIDRHLAESGNPVDV